MPESEQARAGEHAEHQVTPLELFFDLVFVFAVTQVTRLITDDPTWRGALHGLLVLAAIWWAWIGYSWLTSTTDVDEGAVRLAMLAAMTAMLGVALSEPRAFAGDALLFAVCYTLVRVLHVVLSMVVSHGDVNRRSALSGFAPTAVLSVTLFVAAAFFPGTPRVVMWLVALIVDFAGPAIIGMGRGWHVAPAHFAERYGNVVLIALGESIVAIGVGAGLRLSAGVIVGATLSMVVVSALWWLYFDVAAIMARQRLARATGLERAVLARDAYSYLHLPMISGIVLLAFALRSTLEHIGQHLSTLSAVALCAGAALYLLGNVAFLYRALHYLFRRRTVGAVVLLVLIPAAQALPALAALALVTAVCALIVAYEAIRYRPNRLQLRHAELTG